MRQFQLEEAVDNEDFQEAAKLKQTIASATASDTVSEVMTGLKVASGWLQSSHISLELTSSLFLEKPFTRRAILVATLTECCL